MPTKRGGQSSARESSQGNRKPQHPHIICHESRFPQHPQIVHSRKTKHCHRGTKSSSWLHRLRQAPHTRRTKKCFASTENCCTRLRFWIPRSRTQTTRRMDICIVCITRAGRTRKLSNISYYQNRRLRPFVLPCSIDEHAGGTLLLFASFYHAGRVCYVLCVFASVN